jgi:hypothetical protein
LFLTYGEAEKQSKISGKAAVTKHASFKEYDSRTFEVTVRKVLQERTGLSTELPNNTKYGT